MNYCIPNTDIEYMILTETNYLLVAKWCSGIVKERPDNFEKYIVFYNDIENMYGVVDINQVLVKIANQFMIFKYEDFYNNFTQIKREI